MMKHRSKTIFHIMGLLLAALVVGSCSDELVEGNQSSDEVQPDGMAFDIRVEELAERLVAMGQQTKATALGDPDKDGSAVTPFEGGEGLSVHRLTLPFVGIHPGTVPAGSVAEAETKASTADIVGSDYKAFHDTMAVWGYTDKNRVLFNNTLLTKVNGWRSSLRWPYDTKRNEYVTSDDMLNPTKMKFYALSPSLEAMEMALKNSPSYTVKPQFEYTVPDNPAAQRDLLYGESDDISIGIASIDRDAHLGNDDKTVKLSFRHILTAVRFAQGKMPAGLTIRSITLSKIMNKGTYDAATPGWSGQTGEEMYTIEPNSASGAFGTHQYVDNNEVLFLMPQTLDSGAKLEVVVRDGGGIDHTLKADISGTWAAGATVTYVVTVGEMADDYYFIVSESSTRAATTDPSIAGQAKDYATGTVIGNFYVHSYFNYKDYHVNPATDTGSPDAAKWAIEGFSTTEDGTYSFPAPSWIYSMTGLDGVVQEGVTTPVSYQFTAQTQLNHQTTLNGNNLGGQTNVDLSTHNLIGNGDPTSKSQTTANCYIVNAAGTYTFPLVYGNAIENGTTKTWSAADGGTLNPGKIFVDHAGREIEDANILSQVNYTKSTEADQSATSEDIAKYPAAHYVTVTTVVKYNNSASDLTAGLVWQDQEGLVSVGSPGAGSLSFSVKANPEPGNAVIALYGRKTEQQIREVFKEDKTFLGTWKSPADDVASDATPEILWTWHIWVTDEVLPNNDTYTDDKLYPSYNTVNNSRIAALEDYDTPATKHNILPVNLGWVPDDMNWYVYEQREIWVKLKQLKSDGTTPTGKYVTLKLREEAVPQCVSGTSTMYQWGRPTALPMKQKIGGTPRTIYGTTPTTSEDIITTAQAAILNPDKMAKGWNPTAAYWGATKTLYDPCPPGYQLPAGTIFQVFSLTGAELTSSGTSLNMRDGEGADSKGAYMYAVKHAALNDANRYDAKVYIPASGKVSDSYVQANTTTGYSWTSGDGISFQLDPTSGLLKWETTDVGVGKGDALPIRPMATP